MSSIDKLINFQDDLSSRISKAHVNFKKSPRERITQIYVEGRLESLEQLWSEFLSGHKELMRTYDAKTLNATEYVTKELYDETEEAYEDYKCALKLALSHFTRGTQSHTQSPSGNSSRSVQVKLPKINIPNFSGKYSEWSTFRNLFHSLIHVNEDLDKVQKLQYLKGYLVGEAEQLLRHMPILNENYDRCWQMLEERYNNKKYVCHQILKRFFSQRNLQTESFSGLKDLIDTTNDCLSTLNNVGVETKGWDILIIHILTLKLDNETRRQWEFNISNCTSSDELPTYNQFKDFLTNRYRAIEFLDSKVNSNKNQNNSGNKLKALHTAQTICPLCSEEHRLSSCKKFSQETVDSRRDFVQENNLCFNCLGSNHSAKACLSKNKCRICKRRHHSLLHPKGNEAVNTNVTENIPKMAHVAVSQEDLTCSEEEDEDATPLVSCFSSGKVFNQVLLATALVRALSKNGNSYVVRALLDQGSQASFVTESTAQYLGLEKIPASSEISGLGKDKSVLSKAIVYIELQSMVDPNVTIKVKAHVLKSITSLLPSKRVETLEWEELTKLTLADPNYHTPSRINLLLGAEVYCQILQDGVKKGPLGTPIAQLTSFGWVLSGQVKSMTNVPPNIQVMHCRVDGNEILKRFWELESDTQLPKEKLLTKEEKLCEKIFNETTTRDDSGRYVVRLPFESDNPVVEDSRVIADKRLKSLERRLQRNPALKIKYKEVIQEYQDLGHMKIVPEEEINNERAVYLPHHAVVREDKDTTKVRVVYDASCKGKNNRSLNDQLLVGPTLQPELRHIIMRWRTSPICLAADIIEMYRQVKVSEEDSDYQRILWRDDENSKIQHYKLTRVTFGTASAPYLAVKALQQIAYDEGFKYPWVAERVLNDFYVDDYLTGCETVEQGVKIFEETTELLRRAGFELQKWASNSDKLTQRMKRQGKEQTSNEEFKIKTDEIIKIMGLTWNRTDDTFRYKVNLPPLLPPVTKRKIISDISRFYDPLGWVGPCMILAKIMIQKLWLAGLEWDQLVPEHLLNEWLTYRQELKTLCQIQIPRWTETKKNDRLVELHGFCDASKMAYAAVVYIRVIDAEGRIHVALIASKTKVAPVKQVSIPRLELCGAVLLTRLINEIAKVLNIKQCHLHAWSDSQVVLAWLNSHPRRWSVFVANRVSEILTNLDPHHWAHVSSKRNPADGASRGLRPSELLNCNLWFNGPKFLQESDINYPKPDLTTNEEQIKSHCATVEDVIWDKFSSLRKMVRVMAYCRRFIGKLKRSQNENYTTYLTTKEMTEALTIRIKQVQAENFGDEIETIKKGRELSRTNKLRSLNVFLDDIGVLRVGGRLNRSLLSNDRKHPIIMPKQSHITNLIIADAHQQTLHGGPQLMLTYIQSKFWVLGIKQLVKAYYRKCVVCAKAVAKSQNQLMGQLPEARTSPSRPFKNAGVDYAGPIQVRTTKGRGHKSYKGYICLFVCMATRAIHLEVVSDLTSEGFLQAFKRFVARRGHCANIWSDNGTNFIGAANELTRLERAEQENMLTEVAEALATSGCTWHFIPPHSPNFGGLWEAGVRSVKNHLKRIIGDTTLTFEEMSTVLTQVEACLNSRPLSAISEDVDDFTVLTPGHFLVGEALVTAPDRDFETCNVNSLRRWQHTQRMLQIFWRKWSHEYLTKFLHRYKWSSQKPQVNIGDIVVVKEDGLPPSRWLYGRIIATHPGLDQVVRVVTLKTKNGILKRSISKLCLLPIEK